MNVNSRDEKAFLNRLNAIAEANLNNEKFGVSELAREMGMSRSFIHRQLKKINKQSASQFIRIIRLEKAMEMLKQTSLTGSEVAFQVGFSSPAYFNHCFHEHFGYPPGEVKNQSTAGFDSEKVTKHPSTNEKKRRSISSKKLVFAFIGAIVLIFVFYSIYNVLLVNSSKVKLNVHSEKSIIVLPFKNLSGEKNNQYFADGISEDILNYLTKITDFKVVSRTSAEQFRESLLSSNAIAKQMNVNYILEGSVRRQENNVRISVQLIDARNDHHLWSENYDRKMKDIFAIQSDIAKNVASQLQSILLPEEVEQIEKQHTVNAEAYDYYLMGRFFWNYRTRTSLQKSTEYFEKAIETDPNYALAYAGLADAYYARTFRGWITRETGYKTAYKMAERALELDEKLPEAYAVMGIVSYYGYWEWEKARGLFKQALEIDSNCMVALLYYASLLDILGENEKARIHIDHAIEIEPFFSILYNMSGTIYRDDRKYKESINAYQRSLEINPDYGILYFRIFSHYLKLGDEVSAVMNLKKYFDFNPKFKEYHKEIMNIYENSGIDGLITLMLTVNLEETEKNYFMLARLYAFLGQKDEVLFCLGKTVQKNIQGVPRIIRDPEYEMLHSEPRFLALVDTMRLTPYFNK